MSKPDVVELVSPVPAPPPPSEAGLPAALARARAIRAQPARLAGLRVGLVDNSKANASEFLTDLRDLLVERHGSLPGPTERKEVSGALTDAAVQRLCAGADLVLVASAD